MEEITTSDIFTAGTIMFQTILQSLAGFVPSWIDPKWGLNRSFEMK